MRRAAPWIALAVAILGAAFLLGRSCAAAPTPRPTMPTDPATMEAARPDLIDRSLGERLTAERIQPTATRVAEAPSAGGKRAVAAYCDPVVLLDRGTRVGITGRDSASGRDSSPKVRAILPDFAGRRAGSRLELYSTLNDGRRWSVLYTVRGRATWQSSGDTVLVTGDRLWTRVVRGTVQCAPAIGGGTGLGFLVAGQEGALVGGLSAIAGCVF